MFIVYINICIHGQVFKCVLFRNLVVIYYTFSNQTLMLYFNASYLLNTREFTTATTKTKTTLKALLSLQIFVWENNFKE